MESIKKSLDPAIHQLYFKKNENIPDKILLCPTHNTKVEIDNQIVSPPREFSGGFPNEVNLIGCCDNAIGSVMKHIYDTIYETDK